MTRKVSSTPTDVAKAHDRHARGHARPIREPLHQRRDGRDVPQPEPDTPDHAIAQSHNEKAMKVDSKARDAEAAAKTARAYKHGLPGSVSLDPFAEKSRRQPQHHQSERIRGENDVGYGPVLIGNGLGDSDCPAHRDIEDAESVDFADAHLDRDRGGGDERSTESGMRDRTLP